MSNPKEFMYDYGRGLYFNLTNRCPCSCIFCVRSKTEALGSAENLWLSDEPTAEEVIAALKETDLKQYDEVVFCGYGEPLERIETVLDIADYIKRHTALPIRINTNGLSDLIYGRDTVSMLQGHIDALSVSLNAPDNQTYQKLCQPRFGDKAYPALLKFAEKAVELIGDVTLSVVDVISAAEIAECEQIARRIGAEFRVRSCY